MPNPNTPPPKTGNPSFDGWLWRYLQSQGGGSTPATPELPPHHTLPSLNTPSYWHLNKNQAELLVGGSNTSLHYHADDRNRALHTGSQTSDTISDFTPAVLALVQDSVLASQIFGS